MREETVRHTHEGLQGRDPDECWEKPRRGVSQSCVCLRHKSSALGVWGQPCWPKEEAGALTVHPQGHQP